MEKVPDFFAKNPTKKWETGKEPAEGIIIELEKAIRNHDQTKIKEILSNPQKVKTALLDRREKSKNLEFLHKGFDQLFFDKFGQKENIYDYDSKKIIQWLHDEKLGETALNNDMGASYHLKDGGRFFRMLGVIAENKDNLEDATVTSTALHDLATWETMVNKDYGKAIELNKKVLDSSELHQDEVLLTKAKVGLTVNKPNLKPKLKAGDFSKYAEIFQRHGAEPEAIFATVEAAKAYLALAKGQWGKEAQTLRNSNLEKAEFLALEALKKATRIKYSNSYLHACDVLASVYTEMGKKNKAEKYQNMAKEGQVEVNYKH